MKKIIYSLITLFFFCNCIAQVKKDSIQQAHSIQDSLCGLSIKYNTPGVKLRNRNFIYTEKKVIPIYNEEKDLAILQLGKQKGREEVFLYIKLTPYNTCVKNDDVIELLFDDGKVLTLKNKIQVNCDGNIVTTLPRKQIKFILNKKIISMMIFTFEKDFEFHFTEGLSQQFINDFICLHNHKIR